MDPLSVAASITGLLTASVEVARLFAAFTSAYDYARVVHEEIHAFRFILFALDTFIDSRSNNVARVSMIDMDQVTNVLLGSMYTISELEREVKRLQSKPDGLRRMLWAVAKSGLVDLVQRLQNHKGTINSMLSILTSASQDEALESMRTLQREVAELAKMNAEMSGRLNSMTNGSALSSGASYAGSAMTTMSAGSLLSLSSARANFEMTLKQTRIYRRALLNRVNEPRRTEATQISSAVSLQQPWSMLSGLSLSEISNYSVYSLPISPSELYNPAWYIQSNHTIPLPPITTGDAQTLRLLTGGFAEGLRTALKHNDPVTAKSITSYLPWESVLRLSIGQVRDSDAPTSDTLALFKLWLQCDGDIGRNDQDRATVLKEVMEAGGDWSVFKLLIDKGVSINASWGGKTALHHVSAGRESLSGKRFVDGLWADDSVKLKACRSRVTLKTEFRTCKPEWAVHVLLGLGADINAECSGKLTAIRHAGNAAEWGLVQTLLSHKPHHIPTWGASSLIDAVKKGDKKGLMFILNTGTSVEVTDKTGMTSLHHASKGGHAAIVEFLLGQGASVRSRDDGKKTALHYAAKEGHLDVVEALIRGGADEDALDGTGRTAQHYAIKAGRSDIVRFLRDGRATRFAEFYSTLRSHHASGERYHASGERVDDDSLDSRSRQWDRHVIDFHHSHRLAQK